MLITLYDRKKNIFFSKQIFHDFLVDLRIDACRKK